MDNEILIERALDALREALDMLGGVEYCALDVEDLEYEYSVILDEYTRGEDDDDDDSFDMDDSDSI